MHGVIEEVKLISYVFDYLFMKEGQGLTLLRTQGKMWVKQLQKIHISMILNHQQALNQESRGSDSGPGGSKPAVILPRY